MSQAKNVVLIVCSLAIAAFFISAPTDAQSDHLRFARAANKSHNLILGARQYNDRLVYQENIYKKSGFISSQEVTKTFNVSRYETITRVEALDQKVDGTGAYAKLIRGGPGYNNVTLKFKSQFRHSINFVVRIFAKRFY